MTYVRTLAIHTIILMISFNFPAKIFNLEG